MSSLITDKYSLPPEGWSLKWENPDEIKRQKEIKKKENFERFNNWKNEHMKDYNEEELKKKKLHLYMGQRESTYLGNISYRIRTLFDHPDVSLSREEIIHLTNPLEEEEKKRNDIKLKKKFKEDHIKNEEIQKRREVNDKIQKEKRKEDEKKWRAWYEKVKNYPLKKFSRSENPKKIKERFNKLLYEIRKNGTFSGRINYINGTLKKLSEEKLSDEKKINLYLIHKKDLKKEDEQKKKDKIKLFIKKEEELEKECIEWGIEYMKYDPIPKNQWKKNEYGNQWYGMNYYISSRYKDMKLKLHNKKKIKQFIDDEIKREEDCNKIGITYIPYKKPIPDNPNYNWTSNNSSYFSERNKRMREDKENLELKKEWNKINYEERKKIVEIFERIAKEKEEEHKKKEEERLKKKEEYEKEQFKKYMATILTKAVKSYLYKKYNDINVYNKKLLKEIICFKEIIEYINDKDIKKNYIDLLDTGHEISEYVDCDDIIKNWLKEKNLPDSWTELSDEYVQIGGTGACVFREITVYKDGRRILESSSSFRNRVWEERQNQNPYN
jgi:hypothetical protein